MTPFRFTKCPPFPTEWGTSRSLMGDTRCPPRKERNESTGGLRPPTTEEDQSIPRLTQPPHLQPVENSPAVDHLHHNPQPTNHTHPMTSPRGTHQRHRRTWTTIITTTGWTCRRCGTPITPGQPWDLGHPTDATPGGPTNDHGLQPEHALKKDCPAGGNRSAGATAGNHQRNNRIPPSRTW